MIGAMLGNRYEILEEIGSGGMAIVYKAKCHLLNRFVAIKVLRDEFKVDKEFVKKFNIESQAAASLSNSHIVSVYDVGHEDGIYYIVMEYIEGITLKEYIDQSGMLNWRQALEFTLSICSALEHAHKNGIIHRDIKPQNIIFSTEGVLKVTDFGIARATKMNENSMKETKKFDEDVMGSVHYISPEQAKGTLIDARSDIYSLGVVLYEMLTATLPYDHENPVSIAVMHISSEPPSIKDKNIAVPLGMEKIVKKCMNRDINLRYQNIKELIRDLNALKNDPELNPVKDQDLDNAITKVIFPVKNDQLKMEEIKTEISEPIKTQQDETMNEDVPPEKVKRRFGKNNMLRSNTPNKKADKLAMISAIVASALIIIAMAVFLVKLFFPNFNPIAGFASPSQIQVPNFVGMELEQAKKEAQDVKLSVVSDGEEFSEEYDKGIIISQQPSNIMVKTPYDVKVIVSKGIKTITLPYLAGKETRQAQLELANLGLKFREVFEANSDVPEGYVIRHVPDAGTPLKQTDEVVLYVSKGGQPEPIVVPQLVGLTESDAKRKVEASGLTLGNIIRQPSVKALGIVVAQNIPFESEVDKKTAITITVSNGKKPTGNNTTAADATPKTTAITTDETYNLTINLPTNRDTVSVKVVKDGTTIYEKTVDTNLKTLTVPVRGTGEANVMVYFDSNLVKTQRITF